MTVLSVVVIVLAVVVLRNYGNFARAPFDKLSVVLSTVGLVCVLYGLSTFASSDNMAVTAGLIAAGLVLCALYVRRQLTLPEPMLQVGILRTRKYATAVVIIVIVQAALMGTGVITPLYIQGVLGFSATMSGVAMLPGALIGAFMGLVSGRLFDRFGVRRVVIPGVIVAVLGASGLARLGIDSSFINLDDHLYGARGGPAVHYDAAEHLGRELARQQRHPARSGCVKYVEPGGGLPWHGGAGVHLGAGAFRGSRRRPARAGLPRRSHGLHDHLHFDGRSGARHSVLCARQGEDARRCGRDGGRARCGAVDYAAGFDGVTVDGTLGESWDAERTYTAADVMNREPVCAADTATMAEVIRLMDANQTSGLPVVNGTGDLVGFVSDGDVASYLGKTEIALVDSTLLNGYRYIDDEDAATRLRELMGLNVMAVATRRVISVEATTPVDEVCALFAAKRIKKVPVVENGKLVGALSRRNIMRSLVEAIDILEK